MISSNFYPYPPDPFSPPHRDSLRSCTEKGEGKPVSVATVYVSLGSNIEPEKNVKQAIQLLETKTKVQAISSTYRTAPQGFIEQADFLNMAVCIETSLDPFTFKKEVLDWIERELGRVRDPQNKNAPRTIDLDISLWDNAVFEYGDKPWRVPDPDILKFTHVAIPLAEIAPDYIHPVEHMTLSEIAARFDVSAFERFVLTERKF
jgi:2-amino-4-hydroxy-6-hydroxymethyldihydropteridine diphosphokinase